MDQESEGGRVGLASAIIGEEPSISERLDGETATDRAHIKAEQIAKIGSISRTSREHYDIQVLSMATTSRGVEVFARAWDLNGQIGFGRDGSVDIERFIFVNPPILVPDVNGSITRSAYDPVTEQTFTSTYREDVQEALLQSLEHTVEVKQQKFGSRRIIPQKVGNTTTIVYPDADPESTSVDGYAAFDASTSSWSTIQSATTSASADDTPTQSNGAYTGKGAGQYWIYRAFFLFDTSSIESDTIDSATFSLNPFAKVADSLGNSYISLASSSPASSTVISTADYDQVGATKLATDLNISAILVDGRYNNWILNATGRSTINGNGISKFVLRHGNDIVNSEPSGGGYNGINGIRWADSSGTTQDPKLVVEHFSSSTPIGSYGPLVENGTFRKYEFKDSGSWGSHRQVRGDIHIWLVVNDATAQGKRRHHDVQVDA